MQNLSWGLGIGIILGMAILFSGRNYASSTTAPATTQPATTIPTTKPALIPQYGNLLQRLGEPEFEVREQAQKELAAISWEQRPLLVQLLAISHDGEIRGRITKRINEIDEQLATDPPPISLELQEATFDKTIKALKKATHANLDVWPDGSDQSQGTFTIKARQQPFWKIFLDLSNQHPLSLQDYMGFKIMQNQAGLRHGVIAGGFAVFPTSLTRTVDLQPAPDKPVPTQDLNLAYTVVADPRMKMLKWNQTMLTKVIDDQGNVLLENKEPRQVNWNNQASNIFQSSETLSVPETPGKKILSVKGIIQAMVQISHVQVDLAKPAIGKYIALGQHTFKITKWEVRKDNTIYWIRGSF